MEEIPKEGSQGWKKTYRPRSVSSLLILLRAMVEESDDMVA